MSQEVTIDWLRVDTLLAAGCPGTEVADALGIHADTLYNHVLKKFKKLFTDYAAEKRQKGNAMIREAQFLKALGHNPEADNTMLIWLGKTRLGQQEPDSKNGSSGQVIHLKVDNGLRAGVTIQAEAIPA